MEPPQEPPKLFHSLHHQRKCSVLSLAADANYIYSGSQGNDITVWDKASFTLKTTLRGHAGSVLALEYAPELQVLFSASGDSTIRVWSTETLTPLFIINPHLETDSGDLFCLAWHPRTSSLYFGCQNTSIQWYHFGGFASSEAQPETNGHSLNGHGANSHGPGASRARAPTPRGSPSISSVRSDSIDRLVLDTSFGNGTSTPRRVHKFFDSYPQYERRTPDLNARNPNLGNPGLATPPSPSGFATPPHLQQAMAGLGDACLIPPPAPPPTRTLQVPCENTIWSAHYGYVYCMATVPSIREGADDVPRLNPDSALLLSGSGDSTVKVWNLATKQPTLQHTFDCGYGAVLAVVVRGDTIYAGCQDGHVKILDLETKTHVRSLIITENVDILSLSLLHSDLYTCSANGEVQRWSASFNQTSYWQSHSGIVLSSIVTRLTDPRLSDTAANEANGGSGGHCERFVLVTGGNDDQIKIWEANPPKPAPHTVTDDCKDLDADDLELTSDTMVYTLSKFISIPSVSNSPRHKEDCRQAAIWLRKCLGQLGASSYLLPTGEDTNPLVLATFQGTQTLHKKPRILFYGHYDVISARGSSWESDPFKLSARNGYLYGRGVTDNKGPIMAIACAAADLLKQRALELDVVMLLEGEEEAGSRGFMETVRKNKDKIGPIDAILISNSTWIAEDTPCITYGLRGVIHSIVKVSSNGPDLHSGVDGGAVEEPMVDMVKLLGTLLDGQKRVALPRFYDDVRPLTEEERQLYKVLSAVIQTPASTLSSKWREPSLTIHDVRASVATNSTVIPATVTASVSIRIVPDQDLDTIAEALKQHLETTFSNMRSPNSLDITIKHMADWWLGNLDDLWFTALEDAVREEWGTEPLRIREGGSIPSIPNLEKEFACHALHLPLGQSTDQAHLPNERISLTNLRRGKSVVERFFTNVACHHKR
ncbi:Zn-dependent exopeptidase [Phanerochaete sordida]|uniref:Zn-dependent exopeptidase n=1 Tax=Phanerochaete sordida TaxID=48140 RepID=A0A9P3GBN9_9APHY|nr:Zn-dependent exopeptidase [Phanerochaete sordida]